MAPPREAFVPKAPETPAGRSPAAVTQPPTAPAPADEAPAAPVSLPRDPAARLTALFDAGTMTLLPTVAPEGSGAIAARGLIDGSGAVAFASDPRVQGGAMGT